MPSVLVIAGHGVVTAAAQDAAGAGLWVDDVNVLVQVRSGH